MLIVPASRQAASSEYTPPSPPSAVFERLKISQVSKKFSFAKQRSRHIGLQNILQYKCTTFHTGWQERGLEGLGDINIICSTLGHVVLFSLWGTGDIYYIFS